MTLNIKYFGMLAEVTHSKSETLLFSGETVTDLLKMLVEKYPTLKEKEFQVAHNQVLVPHHTKISDPEIALLPPFAGG